MNPITIKQIMQSTGALLAQGRAEISVEGVSTDTRKLKPGDLFVALSGPNFDGNDYCLQAFERGARAVMLRAPVRDPNGDRGHTARLDPLRRPRPDSLEGLELPRGKPVLFSSSPLRSLARLARWYRSQLDARVIGITGSCGKTTTKNILLELLGHVGDVAGSPNSFNNEIGLPLSVMLAEESTRWLVLELGTNSPGEISRLTGIARPDLGVITNVGSAHLAGLRTEEGVAREKGALAEGLPKNGRLVLNADCRFTPFIREHTAASVLTFSVEGDGDLDATDIVFHAGGTTFRLGNRTITSPLLGLHNLQNLLAALAAVRALDVPIELVLPAVTRLAAGRRRMERIELAGLTLFDDSYNANPDSARASVRVLAGLHGFRRRVLVMGDMLELGDSAPELHHALGREAAELGLDALVLVGDLSRATAAGALEAGMQKSNVTHVADSEAARWVLSEMLQDGDVVLVKGSNAMRMDELVRYLVETHQQLSV